MTTEKRSYEGWAIIELMGHRRLGGKVSQAEQYGTVMLRVDIPVPEVIEGGGDTWATQFYGGSVIYALTPTTEAIARAVAARNQPEPVHIWELPAPKAAKEDLVDRYMAGLQRDEEVDGLHDVDEVEDEY